MAEEVPAEAVADATKGDESEEVKTDVEHGEGEGIVAEGEHAEGEHVEGEHVEGEHVEGEHVEGEHVEGEQIETEHVEGDQTEGEQTETEDGEKVLGEGEELVGEGLEGEQAAVVPETKKEEEMEMVEEEEAYVEPPPPDPAAPYDLSDSKEALKEPFSLRPDQLAEVEKLWELYQDYTPAYTDIDNYITKKELIYMLKALMLTTYTPEQFEELVAYCVRPPHPKGHITFDQFLKMVTIRQRTIVIEEELRAALQLLDPGKTGSMDREFLRELLLNSGNKMTPKQVNALIKEVDIANDGTIGVEDVVGTMGIDLNKEDIIMLRQAVYGIDAPAAEEEED